MTFACWVSSVPRISTNPTEPTFHPIEMFVHVVLNSIWIGDPSDSYSQVFNKMWRHRNISGPFLLWHPMMTSWQRVFLKSSTSVTMASVRSPTHYVKNMLTRWLQIIRIWKSIWYTWSKKKKKKGHHISRLVSLDDDAGSQVISEVKNRTSHWFKKKEKK